MKLFTKLYYHYRINQAHSGFQEAYRTFKIMQRYDNKLTLRSHIIMRRKIKEISEWNAKLRTL